MYDSKHCFNCHKIVGCTKINPKACTDFEPHYYTHREVAKMCHTAERFLNKVIRDFGIQQAIRLIRSLSHNEDITYEKADNGKIYFCRKIRRDK